METNTKNIALAFFFCAALHSSAQFSIDWYKISGGGGSSAGGNYSLSGTIGQHDAEGPMTSGPYSLTGGFWVRNLECRPCRSGTESGAADSVETSGNRKSVCIGPRGR
jgi:hypothetical protein